MKKKLFCTFIAFALVLTGALCLTACGNGSGGDSCVSASVKIKAAALNGEYDYIDGVGISLGSGFSGGDLWDEGSMFYENDDVLPGTTYTTDISYKRGYDPSSVTVTEKNGLSFSKRLGSAATNDEYKLYIDYTPVGGEHYEFTLTVPSAQVKTARFLEIERILDSNSANVQDFLNCAEVYVNGTFTNVKELSDKSLSVNMLDEYFCVYAKFDNDAKRVKFDNDYKYFLMIGERTAEVSYEQIPGTSQYAYAFKFPTRHLDGDVAIRINEDSIISIGYRDSKISTSFSVTTASETKYTINDGEQRITKGYQFKLNRYKVDDGEFVSANGLNNLTKEYGKTYVFEYVLTKAVVRVDGVENDDKSNALFGKTYKGGIKLTVNDNSVTTEANNDGASYTYQFTIGPNVLPVDMYTGVPENFDNFDVSIDKMSVTPYNSTYVALTSEFDLDHLFFSDDGYEKFAECKTSEGNYVLYTAGSLGSPCTTHLSIPMSYKRFKVRVNQNGIDYTSDPFVMGTDYYITLDDFVSSDYKIISTHGEKKVYLLGDGQTTDPYISVIIPEYGDLSVGVYPGNANITKLKIDILEAEYIPAEVEFDSTLEGGVLTTKDGDEVEDNIIIADKEYNIAVPVATLDGYNDIKFKLYSGDKLIGTLEKEDYDQKFNLSDELINLGFNTRYFDNVLSFYGCGGSDQYGYVATGTVKFYNAVWTKLFSGTSGEADYEEYHVLIDKIVVTL